MNLMLWIGLTLFALALLLLARAVRKAPLGYEDREGFHFGREPVLIPVLTASDRHDLARIQTLRERRVGADELAA